MQHGKKVSVVIPAYNELATHLEEVRTSLQQALQALQGPAADLQEIGPDPLANLPVELDREGIDTLRHVLRSI